MFDPVISRLQCGELARQLRLGSGMGPGEAEGLLRALTTSFYATKLTKIENGVIAPTSADVQAMIGIYLPTVEQAEQLRALAREARQRARPGATPSARARQYLSLERLAVEIRMVYNEIPGLLQTHEYAYALLSASPLVEASRVAALADERAERGHRIIHPGGPRVWVAIGEDGLTRSSGGPAVLRRQLEHLHRIAQMPNATFRVVTREAGNVAALALPFTLLHTAEGRSIALVANVTRSDYVKATDPYLNTFQNAWERAAPEEESAAILEARIAELPDS